MPLPEDTNMNHAEELQQNQVTDKLQLTTYHHGDVEKENISPTPQQKCYKDVLISSNMHNCSYHNCCKKGDLENIANLNISPGRWRFYFIFGLYEKAFPLGLLRRKLVALLDLQQGFHLVDIDYGFCVVKLECEEDMYKVIFQRPWVVFGSFMFITK